MPSEYAWARSTEQQQSSHMFQPITTETRGAFNSSKPRLGKRLSDDSGDSRQTSYLSQRLSVVLQHFNSVLVRESFAGEGEEPDL